MADPIAFMGGRFVSVSEASVAVYDTGFVLGATIAEQLRTFRGQLFHAEAHAQRFLQSAETVGIELEYDFDQLLELAREVVDRNFGLLPPGGDLGLAMFATPGAYPTLAPSGRLPVMGHGDASDPLAASRPTFCLHSFPLPFGLWADSYRRGVTLETTDIRQVPADCWPRGLKCRSRMHYYLADRQAARQRPGARALLLDQQDHVCETSTANVLIYRQDEGLVTPPREDVLPGVSLGYVVEELAPQCQLAINFKRLTVDDLYAADEVLLASTPYCLLPVSALNGREIGSGGCGPITRRLLDRWGDTVGLSIGGQAEACSGS
jgi:branched-subunit amino acid aminotransferase/4-amino-4-deoxychorismate lyase